MQRVFARAGAAFGVAAGAAVFLMAFHGQAASQLLDPGWQLVYPGQGQPSQSSYGYGPAGAAANGGLIQNLFGNGAGQTTIPRPYQPAPAYQQVPQQQMPQQQMRGYQPAPVYYQQAPQQQMPQQQVRGYQSAPVYYQQAPQQQAPQQQVRGYQTAPVYSQQLPQQQRTYQPGPAYYQRSPQQPRAASYQQAPQQLAPVYYQQAPQQPARSYQPAPGFYQQAPAAQQPATAYYQQGSQPDAYPPGQQYYQPAPALQQRASRGDPALGYAPPGEGAGPPVDPKYDRQVVDYRGDEPPGTVVIDTPHFFLYLVMEGGKALRYGIGVGRPGFAWAGNKEITAMRQWPDWYPPVEMLQRRPDLPRYMPGGPTNPLGARALYLGSTLYRIHGSNEPWTIGTQVSSGCIRLRNEDVIDLYGRVKVGTKVIVI